MRPIAEIHHYHAHVYFDDSTRDKALLLREQIGERFNVQIGRAHDQPIGPHPVAQYEIGFFADELPLLLPWLMLNRQDLTVLVHPNTDQERADHAQGAAWLGPVIPLLFDKLDESLIAAGHGAPRAVIINSHPAISV